MKQCAQGDKGEVQNKGGDDVCMCAQLCPTLCKPMDCSPPGSSVHGISQARLLKWVAISFSRGSSQSRDRPQVSSTAGRFFSVSATSVAQARVLWDWPPRSLLLLLLSHFSRVQLFETPWTEARQALLSMGFPRQDYRSGLLVPSPGESSGPRD